MKIGKTTVIRTTPRRRAVKAKPIEQPIERPIPIELPKKKEADVPTK